MRIQLSDGTKWRIYFQHFRHTDNDDPRRAAAVGAVLDAVEVRLGLRSYRIEGATLCWLTPQDKQPFGDAHGVGAQSCIDQWDAEAGRQAALGRALQHVFPKTDPEWKKKRTEVWVQYFNRFTPPVKPQPQAEEQTV